MFQVGINIAKGLSGMQDQWKRVKLQSDKKSFLIEMGRNPFPTVYEKATGSFPIFVHSWLTRLNVEYCQWRIIGSQVICVVSFDGVIRRSKGFVKMEGGYQISQHHFSVLHFIKDDSGDKGFDGIGIKLY